MRKTIALVLTTSQLIGCAAPSTPYLLGQGFYSDKYAKTEIQNKVATNKVRPLGRFETSAGACFNTSQTTIDQNIVIPAIRRELSARGAEVADNVTASERWLMDFGLGLLIVPTLLGCSNWNISGDVLKMAP